LKGPTRAILERAVMADANGSKLPYWECSRFAVPLQHDGTYLEPPKGQPGAARCQGFVIRPLLCNRSGGPPEREQEDLPKGSRRTSRKGAGGPPEREQEVPSETASQPSKMRLCCGGRQGQFPVDRSLLVTCCIKPLDGAASACRIWPRWLQETGRASLGAEGAHISSAPMRLGGSVVAAGR
jgi:hypothetical protein